MPLFRAIYVRQDKPKGITFYAASANAAVVYAEEVIQQYVGKPPILALIPIKSRQRKCRTVELSPNSTV